MKKLFNLFTICLIALGGCMSDLNSDIPVSSDDLIDQNVVYKSETVKVDVEDIEQPTTKTEPAKEEIASSESENVKVIVPPPAVEDETVDFVDASYNDDMSFDVDFENAVAQAESRRGIKSTRKVEALPVVVSNAKDETKPLIPAKRKLEVKNVEPQRDITFLSTIIYHSNTKADISNRDMKALKNVANFVRKNNAVVRVVGSASSRSKDMKEIQNKIENFDLSLLRAQRVRDALVSFGVPSEKIFISAVADTEKVVEENMPLNEAINRRTEVYINY